MISINVVSKADALKLKPEPTSATLTTIPYVVHAYSVHAIYAALPKTAGGILHSTILKTGFDSICAAFRNSEKASLQHIGKTTPTTRAGVYFTGLSTTKSVFLKGAVGLDIVCVA